MRLCDGCNHWKATIGTPAKYVRALPYGKEEAFCSQCYHKYVGYAHISLDPLPITVIIPVSKDPQTQMQVAAIIAERDEAELDLAEWRKRHVG